MKNQILKFEKVTGEKLEIKDGKPHYSGSLYLRGTAITALPDNLTVGGSLNLEGTAIAALPDNLTVGVSLYLRGTAIAALPDNLTVGVSLYLRGTAITALPDNLTVGGSLDLEGTAITALPDNLTVGGYLDLRGTAITALPDNLTVGGSLNLRGTALENTNPKYNRLQENHLFTWQGGKYIMADGVLTEFISKKGNVYKVVKVGSKKESYLVTDGNGKYAHGDTIKEAKEDLIYKILNRDTSVYEGLKLDNELTFQQAIECYRVITGACSQGTRSFVESKIIAPKSSYTIAEIIKLTDGNYGNESFKTFFTK